MAGREGPIFFRRISTCRYSRKVWPRKTEFGTVHVGRVPRSQPRPNHKGVLASPVLGTSYMRTHGPETVTKFCMVIKLDKMKSFFCGRPRPLPHPIFCVKIMLTRDLFAIANPLVEHEGLIITLLQIYCWVRWYIGVKTFECRSTCDEVIGNRRVSCNCSLTRGGSFNSVWDVEQWKRKDAFYSSSPNVKGKHDSLVSHTGTQERHNVAPPDEWKRL